MGPGRPPCQSAAVWSTRGDATCSHRFSALIFPDCISRLESQICSAPSRSPPACADRTRCKGGRRVCSGSGSYGTPPAEALAARPSPRQARVCALPPVDMACCCCRKSSHTGHLVCAYAHSNGVYTAGVKVTLQLCIIPFSKCQLLAQKLSKTDSNSL